MMGEGWELYALAAKMALEQVDDWRRGARLGQALADNILRNLGAVEMSSSRISATRRHTRS